MRLLLDTHVIIWVMDDSTRLSPLAATELSNPANELFVSAATIWELSIKVGSGKLSLSGPYRDWMNRALTDLALSVLPITIDYADSQAG